MNLVSRNLSSSPVDKHLSIKLVLKCEYCNVFFFTNFYGSSYLYVCLVFELSFLRYRPLNTIHNGITVSITSDLSASFASDDFPHQHHGSPTLHNGILTLLLSYSSTKDEGYKRVVPKSVFTVPIGELQGGELEFTQCQYLRYVAYPTDEVKHSVSRHLPASTSPRHYVTCEYVVVKPVPNFAQLEDIHLLTSMEFDSVPFQYQQHHVSTSYRINFSVSNAIMIGGYRGQDDHKKGTTIQYTTKGFYISKLQLTTENTFLGIFPAVDAFSATIDHTFSCSLTASVTTPKKICGADSRLVESNTTAFNDISTHVFGKISSMLITLKNLPVLDVRDDAIIDYEIECPDMISGRETNSIVPVLANYRSSRNVVMEAFKMPLSAIKNKASYTASAGILGSILVAAILSIFV